MKNFKKVILGAGLVLALAGCGGSSLQELSQEEIKEMGGKVTIDYVKKYLNLKEVYSAKNLADLTDEDFAKDARKKANFDRSKFILLGKKQNDVISVIGVSCNNYDENIQIGERIQEKNISFKKDCLMGSLFIDMYRDYKAIKDFREKHNL
ncbi:hypothetical protein KJQ67_07300 [Campylobacter lari]|uniref:hypothetical protein n=1 Tax=Campylobacter lari TaxID=201 RepID=UPI001307E7C3|nr:hypothetical protein [Campylobacter lari]MBT0821027.1 hypothetical protein [Campylobacter lari]